jgi:hypothetical protein
MLKIEVNCSLILLAIFVVSMLGSLTHADPNSVYALFAFYALLTHPQYNSIREVLLILMLVTLLVFLADIWALVLLAIEPIGGTNRVLGYVWTAIEMGLKIALMVFLIMWRKHIQEEDLRKESGPRESRLTH